jgi:hypothetical protein
LLVVLRSPATWDAAGIARVAITQTFGNRTATGMIGRAIQMLVHQGQCTRYDIFDSGPQRVTTQRRYPTVKKSSVSSRAIRATAKAATTRETTITPLL